MYVKEITLKYGKACTKVTSTMCSSIDVNAFMRQAFDIEGEIKEHFFVVPLNARSKPLGWIRVATGNLSKVACGISDVLRPVIISGAERFLIAHNHPSGESDPSEEDKVLTKRLVQAANIMNLTLLDHLILTDTGYFSFADECILPSC